MKIYMALPTRMFLLAILVLSALPAAALPGELDAVIRRCGTPHAQNYTTSQVTGRPQRDLIYSDSLLLHFEPEEGGWSFTTAWSGHFPVTRSSLETRLPCFRDALAEVAAKPAVTIDPTIATQTNSPAPVSQTNFGIDHLWLIAVLVVITGVLLLIPRRARKGDVASIPDVRRYRKPLLRERFIRRNRRPPEL